MEDPVKFTYKLKAPGTAEGSLRVNGQTAAFTITNAGNPLSDLLRGMVSLIFEPSHIWEEENIQFIDWYGDETSYKWVFSTVDGETIRLKVTRYADLFESSDGAALLNETCSVFDFYSGVITGLDSFIKSTGLLNYEQQWQKDEFPLTYFLILKKYLVEKGLWNKQSGEAGNLNSEMDILFL